MRAWRADYLRDGLVIERKFMDEALGLSLFPVDKIAKMVMPSNHHESTMRGRGLSTIEAPWAWKWAWAGETRDYIQSPSLCSHSRP